MRIGSLFSGAGGLDMAVEAVFGGRTVWHSEIDKAASNVLAHRWPDVPNLGSITEIDWASVEPVDVLCGGFPCQDVSAAGKRAGIKDGTRSGLWGVFADAIDALRPRYVVIENVRGLLSATAHRAVESDDPVVGDRSDRPVLRALGAVLGDLSDLGYDARWATVAAASVGAPHRRERVFIVATAADSESGAGRDEEQQRVSPLRLRGESDVQQPRECIGRDAISGGHAPHPPRNGCDEGRPESARLVGGFNAAVSSDEPGVALLPTPTQSDGTGGGIRTGLSWEGTTKSTGDGGNSRLRDVAGLLGPLLPTPTAQDGANNGGPSQFQRNTLPLNAEVTLLPTPRTSDTNGAGHHGDCGMDLRTTVTLLPTPAAQDGNGGGRYSSEGHQSTLPGEVRLLPTPKAHDGEFGTPRTTGRPIEKLTHLGTIASLEKTSHWGKYAPAIARWEQIVGPAPAPTEPNKNGNPRLSAAFSEWLMGWPSGWVTDPAIGISRNDQLRIVGNGVCTQQAIAALRFLLAVTA